MSAAAIIGLVCLALILAILLAPWIVCTCTREGRDIQKQIERGEA